MLTLRLKRKRTVQKEGKESNKREGNSPFLAIFVEDRMSLRENKFLRNLKFKLKKVGLKFIANCNVGIIQTKICLTFTKLAFSLGNTEIL